MTTKPTESKKTLRLAVASGKGGTGKTTVSTKLFERLSQMEGLRVELLDCDVEEPNALLFYPQRKTTWEKEAAQLVPRMELSENANI